MLQAKCIYAEDNCKKDLLVSRYEEILQQYEDPMKAIVHRTLEMYTGEALEEFIGDMIGKTFIQASDVKD